MTIALTRDAGHPWSAEPGWDQLGLQFSSIVLLDDKIDEAMRKHWHIWIRDQHQARAVLYKPSGAQETWEDVPRMGTPRALCIALQVGDEVYTDFTGRVTQHRITARETKFTSQTGIMLRVKPVVQKSTDAGNEYVGSNPWIDAAWFRPVNTMRNSA